MTVLALSARADNNVKCVSLGSVFTWYCAKARLHYIAYIPWEQRQKCCDLYTVQYNLGGLNWNVRIQGRSRGGDDIGRLGGRCAHYNFGVSWVHLPFRPVEIFRTLSSVCEMGCDLNTALPPPALVSKQRERQLAYQVVSAVLHGTHWNSGGDGWWQGMGGERWGVLFIWASSREMSTSNVECVQTGSKCWEAAILTKCCGFSHSTGNR